MDAALPDEVTSWGTLVRYSTMSGFRLRLNLLLIISSQAVGAKRHPGRSAGAYLQWMLLFPL